MKKDDVERQREAEEVGCTGLIDGQARNLYTHEAFWASSATSDIKGPGPFDFFEGGDID